MSRTPENTDQACDLVKYERREGQTITAVQLNLEMDEFTYRKWGGVQRCKAGDWLVDNEGEAYTVDRDSFEATYTRVGPGQFRKSAPVWAKEATADGTIRTKEGTTAYGAGYFLVYNDSDGLDGYAMSPEAFHRLYERPDGLDSPAPAPGADQLGSC